MGCLFSCFKKNGKTNLQDSLMDGENKDLENGTDNTEADLIEFSDQSAKQMTIVGSSNGSKKVSVDSFIFLKVLGKGSFGKVVLVQKKDTSNLYAMKILRKDAIKKRNQKIHTKAERDILENVNCPFIIQLHFAFQSSTKLYLIMDFMSGGELFFHLRREKKFTESRAKFYAAEIVLALEHLHAQGIIYRDLKPENILMDSDGHIKICDFGLSKQGIEGDKKAFTFCGTPEYLAPEILKGVGHDKAVDYWSLGALLYEMLSGAPPFYSRDRNQMFKNILEKPIEMKPFFSSEACSLLSALLVVTPSKRMSSHKEIKKHEFFRSIDWEKLSRREIRAPFQPNPINLKDLKYFDKMFTDENINETLVTRTMNGPTGNTFQGFTYIPGRHSNDTEPMQTFETTDKNHLHNNDLN